MEGFEHLVKVALESENLIVTSNLKFFVRRKTRRQDRDEFQTHGYEVDLVGARQDRLVLASVKSYFGSKGVNRNGFVGIAVQTRNNRASDYKLFNYPDIRHGVIRQAAKQFGYSIRQVELRLYVGRFQSMREEEVVTAHLQRIRAGAGRVRVVGLAEIVEAVLRVADSGTYVNDPVVMTLKALKAANRLQELATS